MSESEEQAGGGMDSGMRVYRYGLLPPFENGDVARDQMRLAHRYRNMLVEIERGHRAAARALTSTLGDVGRLEGEARAAIDANAVAFRALKDARSEARSKKDVSDSLRRAAEESKARMNAALRALATERRRVESNRPLDAAMDAHELGERTGLVDVDLYIAARVAYGLVPGGPNSAAKKAAREAREDAAYAIHDAPTCDGHPLRVAVRFDAISLRAAGLRRAAREICGLFFGTSGLIEAADEASRKKMPTYDGVEPNDPHFVRWDGEGAVGVQSLTMPVAAAHGDSNDIRIERRTFEYTRIKREPARMHEHADGSRTLDGGRVVRGPDGRPIREAFTVERQVLCFRVGTIGRRTPIMAAFELPPGQRPLPEGGVIKRASVHVRKIGLREEWYATITVNVSACSRPRPVGHGVVAVDVGWRMIGDEIRVAAWRGDDGAEGELRLDARAIARIRYPGQLRSTRDKNFDAMRAALSEWLKNNDLPEWLKKSARSIALWKAPAAMARLVKQWASNRFAGDEDIFGRLPTREEIARGERGPGLVGWEAQDRHLWQWESDQRTSALRHRREIYRVFAAQMVGRYERVIVEDFDKRTVARRPAENSTEDVNETSRSNRFIVATSELCGALANAFGKARTIKLDPKDSTRTCNVCGLVEDVDAASDVVIVCSGCGSARDQDASAAEVLLRTWQDRERRRDAQGTGAARNDGNVSDPVVVEGNRFDRARARKAARRAAEGTARKAVANVPESQ